MLKLKILLILIGIGIAAILFQTDKYYANKLIQIELDNALKDLKTQYSVMRYNYDVSADSIYERIVSDEAIIEILKKYNQTSNKPEQNSLRNDLGKHVAIEYHSSKQIGLKMIVFAAPDNKIIYRAHKKDKFGDDISDIRYSIKYVNEKHKKISGFESGKLIHAFRNVYPIFDKDKNYLGCIDIGFSSKYLQNTLEDVHKLHTHFLVNRHNSEVRVWNKSEFNNEYKVSMEDDDFLVSVRKNVYHDFKNLSKSTVIKNSALIHQNMEKGKEFILYGMDENMAIVISFVPIFNIHDKTKLDAYIVSYTPNEQILRISDNSRYIGFGIIFGVLFTMYQIYHLISRRKYLEIEVKNKTKELKEINENLELRVQEEVQKNIHNEFKLYEQSKLAALGDMIGNIIHQWRQPLSIISTVTSIMLVKNEMRCLSQDDIRNDLNKVLYKTNYLSETIDIFRNYMREKKEKKVVIVQERIDVALKICQSVLDDNHIELKNNIDYEKNFEIEIVLGELVQVIINIINNGKDAIVEKKIKEGWIQLDLDVIDNYVVITIEDNGGGIPDEVMPRVFEKHFTTKSEESGTGLGLHMSHEIITQSLDGKLYVKNTPNGAKFFIELPCIIC